MTADELIAEVKIAYRTPSVWVEKRLGWYRVTVWRGSECVATCSASTKREALNDVLLRAPEVRT